MQPHLFLIPASATGGKTEVFMSKKRISAIFALGLIALLYLMTLIFALIDSPWAKSCLMASLFCTIVVPVFLYLYLILIKRWTKEKGDER